jgi:hypothetical protein
MSSRLIQCPGFADGYLITALRDQQDCMIWCLCVTRDGRESVLALPLDAVEALPSSDIDALYGISEAERESYEVDDKEGQVIAEETASDAENASPEERAEHAKAMDEIRICAPSFDDFLRRLWLEDEIGWKLAGLDLAPLTAVEQRYLEHYT